MQVDVNGYVIGFTIQGDSCGADSLVFYFQVWVSAMGTVSDSHPSMWSRIHHNRTTTTVPSKFHSLFRNKSTDHNRAE